MNVGNAGVKVTMSGKILVDEADQSSVKNIFALGDIAEVIDLYYMPVIKGPFIL